MTWVLIKIAIRLVAFTAVFWLATWPRRGAAGSRAGEARTPEGAAPRRARISIQPRWAIPLVGVVFAGLNILLYWLLRPVLDLATLRMFSLAMPLVVNGLLLWGTARLVARKQWLKVDGILAAAWLAGILTLAHGALWLGLDYLPAHL
jgi:uncharacterized membrane protein YvlD (DUF360 family)